MSGTKERKITRKGVLVTLGIICIILVASLGGVVAAYTLMINDKNNTISSLTNQISQLNSSIANLQSQVASENSTINSLTSQVANLQKELNPNTTYTAAGVLDGLELTMRLENIVYILGEPVNITLTVTNISNQTMNYNFEHPNFDFRVYNDTNDNLYQWSNTQVSLNYGSIIPLNPGESLASGNLVWPQTCNVMDGSQSFPVSPGTYYIVGYDLGNGTQTGPIQITISQPI
ncbi:MAG: BsuPI-related putative proteinase inhibitor [Candidatus Bathyarchaeia archaeon]